MEFEPIMFLMSYFLNIRFNFDPSFLCLKQIRNKFKIHTWNLVPNSKLIFIEILYFILCVCVCIYIYVCIYIHIYIYITWIDSHKFLTEKSLTKWAELVRTRLHFRNYVLTGNLMTCSLVSCFCDHCRPALLHIVAITCSTGTSPMMGRNSMVCSPWAVGPQRTGSANSRRPNREGWWGEDWAV